MKIRVISPVTSDKVVKITSQQYLAAGRPDAQVSVVTLDQGTASIECRFERALATPGVVARAVEAEKDGVQAVISDCMEDPGVGEAREMVTIPVIASGGAGALEHFAEIIKEADASAALAASLFHFKELSIQEVKDYLAVEGVLVRSRK